MNTMEPTDQPNELQDAPTLKGLSRENPFVVPDGFFDRFPHSVQGRVVETGPSSNGATWLRPRMLFPVLASMAVLLTIWQLWPEPNAARQLTEGTIEPEDLPRGTWNTDLLYEELGEDAFYTTMALPADDDVLFAYLDNEDLTLEQLIEEL